MFCPYCGKQIADDSSFCELCGNSLKKKKSGKNKPGSGKRKILMTVIFAIIGILIIMGAFLLIKKFLGETESNSCVWVSDKGYEFAKDITKKKQESIFLSDLTLNQEEPKVESEYAHFSSDGRYLYFFNRLTDENTGTLYRAELGKIKKSEDEDTYKVQIASDVSTDLFRIFEDGTACYVKPDYSDDTYELYYFNGEESSIVGKEIYSIKYFEKEIVFSKEQDNEHDSIYYKNLGSEEDPKKLVTNVVEWEAQDSDHIIFTQNYDEEDNTRSLFIVGKNTDALKIADDVYTYSCIETGLVYYEVLSKQEFNLGSAVTYDRYDADKSMKKPDSSDSKYQVQDSVWTSLSNTYYEDLNEYNAAQRRLENLEYLKTVTADLKIYSLNCFDLDKGEKKEIAGSVENMIFCSCSGEVSGVAYHKSVSELNPVDISDYIDLSMASDLEYGAVEAVNAACINKDKVYFTMFGGEEQELDTSSLGLTSNSQIFFCLFDSGKKAGFMETVYDEDEMIQSTNIFVADVKKNKIGPFNTVSLNGGTSIEHIGNKLYGYDSTGDSYMLVDDEFILFSENNDSVQSNKITWYGDGSLLFIDNYQENYGGTLVQFDAKGKKNKIADDVTEFMQLDNENILYITNDNLKIYNGKESSILSSDVNMFWAPNEKDVYCKIDMYQWIE